MLRLSSAPVCAKNLQAIYLNKHHKINSFSQFLHKDHPVKKTTYKTSYVSHPKNLIRNAIRSSKNLRIHPKF